MSKSFSDKKFCSWCGGDLKQISSSQLECRNCKTGEYNNPKSAAGAYVINEKGEILLSTRAHDPGKGYLDIPGGFIDGFELPEQAVVRELKEETGLDITESELKLVGTTIHPYEFQGKMSAALPILFVIHLNRPVSVSPSDDVSSLSWTAPRKIDFSKFAWPELAEALKSYLHAQNML